MSKGGGAKIPTTQELKELAEFENTINNPNVSNMFGSQSFTRGADGRQTADQQLSPALSGLMENVFTGLSNGPSQFQPQGNQYTQDMINGFSQRLGQRAGFNPSDFEGMQVQEPINYTQPDGDTIGSLLGQQGPQGPQQNIPGANGSGFNMPPQIGAPRPPNPMKEDGMDYTALNPMNKAMSYQDPSPNNGVAIGNGKHKIDWNDKLKDIGSILQAYGGGR